MPPFSPRADELRCTGSTGRRARGRWAFLVVAGVAAGVGLAGCGSSPLKSDATPSTLVSAALTLQHQGNASAARQLLRQAIAKSPRDVDAHYDLGYLDQAAGQSKAALAQYRAALAANPRFAAALYNEATILAARQPATAINLYRRVIALGADVSSARFNLGMTELATGQRAAGIRDLDVALHENPALVSRLTKAQLAAVGRFAKAHPHVKGSAG